MDSQEHFSGSFLDECSKSEQSSSVQLGSPRAHLASCKDDDVEKRFSDHFTDAELDLHPHDDKFDFVSNLQTHDSLSSLDLTYRSDEVATVKNTNQATACSWETFEDSGQKVSHSMDVYSLITPHSNMLWIHRPLPS